MVLGANSVSRLRTREESAVVGLTKKLKRESERRVGAERDAENWKKKYKHLEEVMKNFTGMR